MIDIKLIGVSGLEGAIRSMRNPLNSWDKSDSYACDTQNCANCVDAYRCDGTQFHIGKNDMGLCKKLIKAGPDHRKFLRMIHAQFDVTAPVFFLSEFDTYKIATVRNSCSFMHKGLAKPFKINDFYVSLSILGFISMFEVFWYREYHAIARVLSFNLMLLYSVSLAVAAYLIHSILLIFTNLFESEL